MSDINRKGYILIGNLRFYRTLQCEEKNSLNLGKYAAEYLSICVSILYISGGTYSLKSTPNEKFFEKLLMAILFILRVFARRNPLRRNRRRNNFCIVF